MVVRLVLSALVAVAFPTCALSEGKLSADSLDADPVIISADREINRATQAMEAMEFLQKEINNLPGSTIPPELVLTVHCTIKILLSEPFWKAVDAKDLTVYQACKCIGDAAVSEGLHEQNVAADDMLPLAYIEAQANTNFSSCTPG